MKKLTILLFALFGLLLAGCAEVIGKPGALVLDQTSETATVIQDGIEEANAQAKTILNRRINREEENRRYGEELLNRLIEGNRRVVEGYTARACQYAPGETIELPIHAAKIIVTCPEPPPTDTAEEVE